MEHALFRQFPVSAHAGGFGKARAEGASLSAVEQVGLGASRQNSFYKAFVFHLGHHLGVGSGAEERKWLTV